MYPAPDLNQVGSILREKPTRIIGILFAPPYTECGRETLVPRLGYLNARTAEFIHFFCAGYGGYGFADDIEKIGDVKYKNGVVIPWGFSHTKFASFVEEFEAATNWNYGGEAELILTRADLAFSECILFDLNAMVRDGAIDSTSQLFEAIIKYARNHDHDGLIRDFSIKQGLNVFAESAKDEIIELMPRMARNLWKHGKHYVTQSLAKT